MPKVINRLLNEIESTQVVIMAGGMGKRLGAEIPKPLIRIGEKTLLDICIEYFMNNGFSDIIVLTGYKANQVEDYIKEKFPEIRIGRDPFDPKVKPVGKGKALKNALEKNIIDRSRRAIIAFPDDIFIDPELPVRFLLKHLQGVRFYSILASVVFAVPMIYPFGVGRFDSRGIVYRFEEKPYIEIPTSTGLYLFEPEVYGYIDKFVDLDAPNPVEFENTVISKLAEEKKLFSYIIPGDLWIPVNTIKDLERARRALILL